MTTQTSLFATGHPGVFIEAVTLAAKADRRHNHNRDNKTPSSGPRFRSVIAGLTVLIAVVGATLLMEA